VVRLTIHLDAETALSHNALHHTDGVTALLKHASLFHMELEKSSTGIVRPTR
jgi:hypothetical protein